MEAKIHSTHYTLSSEQQNLHYNAINTVKPVDL